MLEPAFYVPSGLLQKRDDTKQRTLWWEDLLPPSGLIEVVPCAPFNCWTFYFTFTTTDQPAVNQSLQPYHVRSFMKHDISPGPSLSSLLTVSLSGFVNWSSEDSFRAVLEDCQRWDKIICKSEKSMSHHESWPYALSTSIKQFIYFHFFFNGWYLILESSM